MNKAKLIGWLLVSPAILLLISSVIGIVYTLIEFPSAILIVLGSILLWFMFMVGSTILEKVSDDEKKMENR